MFFRSEKHRIPRGYYFRRPGQDGPGKSTWHPELAYSEDVEEHTGLPWFLQLLPPFCPRFFCHRAPTVTAHEKGYSVCLGQRSGKSVQGPHHSLHHSASIGTSGPHEAIPAYHGCQHLRYRRYPRTTRCV